jgi:hypothetical protein
MILLDFEYNDSASKSMGLISVAVGHGQYSRDFWLLDSADREAFIEFMADRVGSPITCFNADAEARCLVALGIDPLDYKWLDLYLDYKQLQNKDNRWLYGRYIGKSVLGAPMVKESIGYNNRHKGKYQSEKDRDRTLAIHKAKANKSGYTTETVTASLMSAVLNFTDISDSQALEDYKVKVETRDIILSKPLRDYTDSEKSAILSYGSQDIRELRDISRNIQICLEKASGLDGTEVMAHRYNRGKVGAMMAIISSNGTPIHKESLDNLTANAESIENEAKFHLNYETGLPLCQWQLKGKSKGEARFDNFKKSYGAIADYISSTDMAKSWPLTTSGKYNLSSDVLGKYKHDPVIKGYLSMLAVGASMKYSKPNEHGESEISSAIGEDNRLRVSLFPFSTQTARNAPKAKQYIYAQGSWMKAVLIDIPKGKKLIETDYSSQEFLIGGVLSGDQAMIEAYKTDVYISFGIASGSYPDRCKGLSVSEIKELSHSDNEVSQVRQGLKAVVLGLSYGAGPETIASNTGLPLKRVEYLVSQYRKTYSVYYDWREKVWGRHVRKGKPLTHHYNGWYLGKDNDNKLSTQNWPVQSTGSALLHRALELVLTEKVEVINSLHDAIYYLVDDDDTTTQGKVETLMLQASTEVLGSDGMKIESEEWLHGSRVITGKGYENWQKYKKYIEPKGK